MAQKFLNGVDLANQKIANLADPSSATDAANKQYVDNYVNGLTLKSAVRAATTANITLSGAQSIDGVAIVAGDRVLVKDQTTASANGIYVAASGAWTRATDADTSAEVKAGLTVFVNEGTVNSDKQFSLVTNGAIVLDTTALTFSPTAASSTSYTAGNGLSLTGSAFAVIPKSGGSLAVDGSGVYIDPAGPLAAKRYSVNVPNNTTAVITHSLGTTDVDVTVKEISSGAIVWPDIIVVDANTVNLVFAVAPGTNTYRATVTA